MDPAEPQKMGQAVLRGGLYLGLGRLPQGWSVPGREVEDADIQQSLRQTVGMAEVPGCAKQLLHALPGLVGMAEHEQGYGQMGERPGPQVGGVEPRWGAVPL